MENEVCENVIKNACVCSGLELTEKMLKQFETYFRMLIEWNEKINLTAITDKEEVYLKHFADCVYGAKLLKPDASLCDIGTGAGFPAVVLKIVRPDLKVTLVDALDKRVKFLNELISKLDLTEIEACHYRAEDKAFKDRFLNSFDYVTARAVANMSTLTEYCLPFVKIGGSFLAYKSDKVEQELELAKNAIGILGGKLKKIHTYELDKTTTRTIVEIEKIKQTNSKYPRDKNKPKLKPL